MLLYQGSQGLSARITCTLITSWINQRVLWWCKSKIAFSCKVAHLPFGFALMEGVPGKSNLQIHQWCPAPHRHMCPMWAVGEDKKGYTLLHLNPLHQNQLWLLNKNNNRESRAGEGKLQTDVFLATTNQRFFSLISSTGMILKSASVSNGNQPFKCMNRHSKWRYIY